MKGITQTPAPGCRLLATRGDTLTLTLHLPHKISGQAWLRTNLGHAATTRLEIIRQVENDRAPLAQDWYDLPMRPLGGEAYQIVVPLHQVGHFEAKAYFLPQGQSTPLWPEGSNTTVNVEPAETCCANIIYNAFVRQFGPNRSGTRTTEWASSTLNELDRQGFAVIPPSGTFRDLIAQLDFITGTLGCTLIQLLPIHPTPTTYARMGRFGSPYAALSFTAVDPALAQFDPAATPLEQFAELVDAVHQRQAKLVLDIAINHTGWAASLHGTHPEWLVRDAAGRIERPGAWGVTWEDLTRLDYRRPDLWQYMAEVFLTWCRRGVDGFRCDAGYMVPVAAWRYMVAKVREQFPDTLFLLEGLGGKISVTRDILNRANFNWAYSELFQNYDRSQIENYLPEALEIAAGDGLTVNYAETHDNLRLASRSPTWARMRTALCALLAPQGAFGFANGVEWLATEKIVVHQSPSLNWGAADNQVDHVRRLTAILKHHPAFHDGAKLALIQIDGGNVVVMLRRPASGPCVIVAANLDDRIPATALWSAAATGLSSCRFWDLISGREVHLEGCSDKLRCPLEPGQVLCLTPHAQDLEMISTAAGHGRPARAELQCVKALALTLWVARKGYGDLADVDPAALATALAEDPWAFCLQLQDPDTAPQTTVWQWPHDLRRQVMVPPGNLLLLTAPHPFRVRLVGPGRVWAAEQSLMANDRSHFAILTPQKASHVGTRQLELFVYGRDGTKRDGAEILYLTAPQRRRARAVWLRAGLPQGPLIFLGTNGRGGMCRASVKWATLHSRYDALLAGNLNPDYPEDRWIMFTRLRGWVVFQGYSQEIQHACLERFAFDHDSRAVWTFRIPAGQGESVRVSACLQMVPQENRIIISFMRHGAEELQAGLEDQRPVTLILRPDVEDRSFHDTTKAFMGPEHRFPSAVNAQPDGFVFAPDPGRQLSTHVSPGGFVYQPEWSYMVHRPLEAGRGLDPDSDLFSPGYFKCALKGGETITLDAAILSGDSRPAPIASPRLPLPLPRRQPPGQALRAAMEQYIVRRRNLATVIAGYPWFLDWGRDTLIFARGLVAAGEFDLSRDIVRQFAQFEAHGTLPNMIRGDDARNRDTSDAPLWLFVVCRDLVAAGHQGILDSACGARTLRQVLMDMGRHLSQGTPNGIRIDPASGLLFSPAHFTWMDTNHPAGTPREGYPIEIQALWYASLTFLAKIDRGAARRHWRDLAARVRNSAAALYYHKAVGYMADCLHGASGCPAGEAEADDALRPNQLFTLTLGLVQDPALGRSILQACEALLVPGGIRSLADREVRHPLTIVHQGRILGDPNRPYRGCYAGDEDTSRKPAYHNGTAWTWVFPTFCEAWHLVYGASGRDAAAALLGSVIDRMNAGCLGHLPELLDGDTPHAARGCDAQAWSVSEAFRVWRLLNDMGD